jgi:hypothetical protein
MKTRPVRPSAPPPPPGQPASGTTRRNDPQPRDAITDGPPQPEIVDPRGPKESTWPRGRFNFGNLVLAGGVLIIVAIVVLTLMAQ